MKLSWPAKSRISVQVIIEQACSKADNNEHCWVLKHLPHMLHAEDLDVNLLLQALIDSLGDAYKECILRIIVQEKLFPFTERMTMPDLAGLFHETFKCLYSHTVLSCDDLQFGLRS